MTENMSSPTPTPTLTPLPGKPSSSVPPTATELAQIPEQPFSAFSSLSQFKVAQRMAMMLAHASIVPENYRGDEHIADCVIVLEIANRIGASVLAVMQNLYVVAGRPGWSSQFLISCLNATKRFSPLRYQMTGRRGKDTLGCIAWAIDKSGQVLKSPEVTIKMAKQEGWFDRLGSKWKTMPALMLCYRSATLFTRLYAPEITMGIQTAEELGDLGLGANGRVSRPIFDGKPSKPKGERRTSGIPKRKISFALKPGRRPPQNRVLRSGVPAAKQHDYLKALTGLIRRSQQSEAGVLQFLVKSGQCNESLASLAELADQQPELVMWAHDNWTKLEQELKPHQKKESR